MPLSTSKITLIVLCGIVALAAKATGQCPAGVRSFLRYNGIWMLNVRSVDGHEPEPKLTKIENRCRAEGSFVTCLQTVDDKSKTLIVYRSTMKDCEFSATEVPEGEGNTSTGLVQIAGDVWTYPWTEEQRGTETRFRVRNIFTESHAIKFEKSSSTDGKNWVAIQVGEERRR